MDVNPSLMVGIQSQPGASPGGPHHQVGAFEEIYRLVDACVSGLLMQNDDLKRRISEPRNLRPVVRYSGFWTPGRIYEPGEMVTFQGSVWSWKDATNTRPPSDRWQLAVKRGLKDAAV